MEHIRASPIGDSVQISQSRLQGWGTPVMANVENRSERVSERAERARKDRAKVNNQVMKLEEATAAVHQSRFSHSERCKTRSFGKEKDSSFT